MKKAFLLFMSVATLMSCSKDDDKPATESSCKITAVNSDEGTSMFEYDDKGRVALVKNRVDDGGYIIRSEYKFIYSDKSITVEWYEDEEIQGKEIYYLEGGRISHTNSIGDNEKVEWKQEFEYNSSNQLSKKTSFDPKSTDGHVTVINYSNDNIADVQAKHISFSSGDVLNDYGKYTAAYNSSARLPYTEQIGGPFSEWFFFDVADGVLYEQGFFGKKPKNQIVSTEHESGKVDITYGKDANGNFNSFSTANRWGTDSYTIVTSCN